LILFSESLFMLNPFLTGSKPILRNKALLQRLVMGLAVCSMAWLLIACQASAEAEMAPEASVAIESAEAAAADAAAEPDVAAVDPQPLEQALAPVRLQIPDIDLDLPVVAMGWHVANVDNQRTTVWTVPEAEVGWHVNSAGAGGAGNTVLSGRQTNGGVFAPLALGAIEPGQFVHLTDADGLVFVYRISEVTQPIPIVGATPEEQQAAAAHLAPGDDARLTLVTGWPDFTTTHRIFAVADFVGVIQ
jgi:sortase (surface protein transpeptidase)